MTLTNICVYCSGQNCMGVVVFVCAPGYIVRMGSCLVDIDSRMCVCGHAGSHHAWPRRLLLDIVAARCASCCMFYRTSFAVRRPRRNELHQKIDRLTQTGRRVKQHRSIETCPCSGIVCLRKNNPRLARWTKLGARWMQRSNVRRIYVPVLHRTWGTWVSHPSLYNQF